MDGSVEEELGGGGNQSAPVRPQDESTGQEEEATQCRGTQDESDRNEKAGGREKRKPVHANGERSTFPGLRPSTWSSNGVRQKDPREATDKKADVVTLTVSVLWPTPAPCFAGGPRARTE